MTVKEIENGLFPLLVYSLNCYNSQVWAGCKPGVRNSFPFFHRSDRGLNTWGVLSFPDAPAGSCVWN